MKIPKRDIYWGWFVVAGAFLVLSINYGARYCFGIFVKPMSAEIPVVPVPFVSLGASINMFVYSACAIYLGRSSRTKWHPAGSLPWGFCGGAELILTSFVKTPLQFYLSMRFTGNRFSGMGWSSVTRPSGKMVLSASGVGHWIKPWGSVSAPLP